MACNTTTAAAIYIGGQHQAAFFLKKRDEMRELCVQYSKHVNICMCIIKNLLC